MTLGFLADTLDLSRFPAPQAIKGVDFEAIFADTMADLVARLAAVGITLDTGNLESEPAAILMQAQAYREMLAKADMNDRVRSVLVAFATGANLDHLAAYFGVRRMVVDVETAESDEALRRRVLLAPEAFASAGPQAAWLFHAMSADARVLNADVWSPAPGSVTVAIQARGGDGTADEDLIEIVRAHLSQAHIKPLTDSLTVRSVVNVPYAINVHAFVQPGPSTELVREQIVASLQAMAAARRTPARDVPRSAIYAAASVGPVDKVIVIDPASDIARDRGEVGVCVGMTVVVETHDG